MGVITFLARVFGITYVFGYLLGIAGIGKHPQAIATFVIVLCMFELMSDWAKKKLKQKT